MSDTLPSTLNVPQQPHESGQLVLRASANHDALVPGTRLDEFEIVRVLGVGGFGIVYLAFDHALQRQVAIKEYMPSALAGRGDGAALVMRSPASAETFVLGLDSFFNEARLLACFDHPSLIKVYRCWKGHGTAYMAMQYYPGITLKQARRGMKGPPDEAWLRAFVEPLLDVLELLHGQGVFHRDIAPDNILLLPDGRPVLLDFGSARRVIGDATQALTAVLKPNFAPIEQYADVVGMRQGPWTDLYALGATVHFMLSGEAPAPAVLRAVRDALPALSVPGGASFAGVPTRFLAAIDWTLALAPEDRPQSVQTVRQAFDGRVVPPQPSARQCVELRASRHEVAVEGRSSAGAVFEPPAHRTDPIVTAPLRDATRAPTPRRRGGRMALAVSALLGLTCVGVLGWTASATSPSPAVASMTEKPAATAATPGSMAARPAPAQLVAPAATPSASSVASSARRRTSAALAPRSPKAACGELNVFSRAICVSRECQAPRWRSHPECAEARAIEEERQRRIDQH